MSTTLWLYRCTDALKAIPLAEILDASDTKKSQSRADNLSNSMADLPDMIDAVGLFCPVGRG